MLLTQTAFHLDCAKKYDLECSKNNFGKNILNAVKMLQNLEPFDLDCIKNVYDSECAQKCFWFGMCTKLLIAKWQKMLLIQKLQNATYLILNAHQLFDLEKKYLEWVSIIWKKPNFGFCVRTNKMLLIWNKKNIIHKELKIRLECAKLMLECFGTR